MRFKEIVPLKYSLSFSFDNDIKTVFMLCYYKMRYDLKMKEKDSKSHAFSFNHNASRYIWFLTKFVHRKTKAFSSRFATQRNYYYYYYKVEIFDSNTKLKACLARLNSIILNIHLNINFKNELEYIYKDSFKITVSVLYSDSSMSSVKKFIKNVIVKRV